METYAEYLEHHGIKGQRWGIRRTPEQLGHRVSERRKAKSSSSTRKSINFLKRKPKTSSSKEEKFTKKAEKRKQIDEKRAVKKAQKDVARREKILQNPTLLYKHRKEFSPEEIKKAMGNIKMEQELRDLSMKNLGVGRQYLETAVRYAESTIKMYNKAANVYNAFGHPKPGKEAPVIGVSPNKDKNKDKDKKK